MLKRFFIACGRRLEAASAFMADAAEWLDGRRDWRAIRADTAERRARARGQE